MSVSPAYSKLNMIGITAYAPQSSVPEPSAVALFVFGLVAVADVVSRRVGKKTL